MYRIFITLTDARTNRNGPTASFRRELVADLAGTRTTDVREGTRMGHRGVYAEAATSRGARFMLEDLLGWATNHRGRVSVRVEYLNKTTLTLAGVMGLVSRDARLAETQRQVANGAWSGKRADERL